MGWLLYRLFFGICACALMVKAKNIASANWFEVEKLIKEVNNARRSESESESKSESVLRHRYNENKTEFWGYVDVRSGAHMFYWLYHSYHPDGYLTRPLIIWLQGGPGQSGSGYGNFELIGPRGLNFTRRSTNWVQEASVLFVDNPVGSGFSYVDESVANYTTNTKEITDDLISFTRQFIDRFHNFTQTPIYVFGESYGGKMAAHFANRLYHEAAAGQISVNVVGFSMGNAWISPGEQSMSYGPLLYQLSLIDDTELKKMQSLGAHIKQRVTTGDYAAAASGFFEIMYLVWTYSHGVDNYNFMVFHRVSFPVAERALFEDEAVLDGATFWSTQASRELPAFMNGPVRRALGVIPPDVTWKTLSSTVKRHLRDMMSSTVHVVEDSLMNTTLQVIVVEGQLDVICNAGGAMRWVQTLNWPGLEQYNSAERLTLLDPDTELTEAYVKAYDRFKFYWILGAGHSVAKDNGPATYRVLQRILGNVDV